MKPITTIETVTKAWDILHKANLHHFMDGAMLYAIGKLDESKLSISDIITDLLSGGVLIEFLSTITASEVYIASDGSHISWKYVEMPVAGEIISAFFTNSIAVFKALKIF